MRHFLELPPEIFEIWKKLENIKIQKNEIIRSQQYEAAAKLRDDERHVWNSLEKAIILANPLAKDSEVLMADYRDMLRYVHPGDADFSNAIDRMDYNKRVGYDILTTCLQLFNKEAGFDETSKKLSSSVDTLREEVKKQLLQKAMNKLFE